MLFNSYFFIFLFLPLTLILFFNMAKYSHRLALGILFIASLIFYSWWDYRYAIPLLVSISINFLIGTQIHAATHLRARKLFLSLGIVFNLGLLAYYKYTDFFIENINVLFDTQLP